MRDQRTHFANQMHEGIPMLQLQESLGQPHQRHAQFGLQCSRSRVRLGQNTP